MRALSIGISLFAVSVAFADGQAPSVPSRNPADYDMAGAQTDEQKRQVQANLAAGKAWALLEGRRIGAIHGTSAGVERAVKDAESEAKDKAFKEALAEFQPEIMTRMEREATIAAFNQVRSAFILTHSHILASIRLNWSGVSAPTVGELGSVTPLIALKERIRLNGLEFGQRSADLHADGWQAEDTAHFTALANTNAQAEVEAKIQSDGPGMIQAEFYNPSSLPECPAEQTTGFPSRLFEGPTADDFKASPSYRATRDMPHPEMAFAFKEGYDSTFLRAAAGAYPQARQIAFRRLFASHKHWEGDRLKKVPVPESIQNFRQEKYQVASRELMLHLIQTYNARLAELREQSRKRTDAAVYPVVYKVEYPKRWEFEKNKLFEAEKQKLSRDSVIGFAGMGLEDGNRDSIFAPGEAVWFNLQLVNYSYMKQTSPLVFDVRPTAAAAPWIQIAQNSVTLRDLAPRCRTNLKKVAPFYLKQESATQLGQSLGMDFGLKLGESPIAYQPAPRAQVASLTVNRAFTIDTITGLDRPGVGGSAQVKVEVTHRGAVANQERVDLVFVLDPGMRAREVPPQPSGRVNPWEPGNTATYWTSLEIEEAQLFQPLKGRIELRQGNWVVAELPFESTPSYGLELRPQVGGVLFFDSNEGGKTAKKIRDAMPASEAYALWDVRRAEGYSRLEAHLSLADWSLPLVLVNPSPANLDTIMSSVGALRQSKRILVFSDEIRGKRLNEVFQEFSSVRALPNVILSSYSELLRVPADAGETNLIPRSVGLVSSFGLDPAQMALKIDDFNVTTLSFDEKMNEYLRAVAHAGGPRGARAGRALNVIIQDLAEQFVRRPEVRTLERMRALVARAKYEKSFDRGVEATYLGKLASSIRRQMDRMKGPDSKLSDIEDLVDELEDFDD